MAKTKSDSSKTTAGEGDSIAHGEEVRVQSHHKPTTISKWVSIGSLMISVGTMYSRRIMKYFRTKYCYDRAMSNIQLFTVPFALISACCGYIGYYLDEKVAMQTIAVDDSNKYSVFNIAFTIALVATGLLFPLNAIQKFRTSPDCVRAYPIFFTLYMLEAVAFTGFVGYIFYSSKSSGYYERFVILIDKVFVWCKQKYSFCCKKTCKGCTWAMSKLPKMPWSAANDASEAVVVVDDEDDRDD